MAREAGSIHECAALEAPPQLPAQRSKPNQVAAERHRDGDERLVGFGGEFEQIQLK